MITWLHDTNNELITDDVNDLKKLSRRSTMRRRGNRTRRQRGGRGRKRFQQGSHSHEYVKAGFTQFAPGQNPDGSWSDWNHAHEIPDWQGHNKMTSTAGSHQHPTGLPRPTIGRGKMRRGGRVRRQMGGLGSGLPKPWQ